MNADELTAEEWDALTEAEKQEATDEHNERAYEDFLRESGQRREW